jgi:hypothetical protein
MSSLQPMGEMRRDDGKRNIFLALGEELPRPDIRPKCARHFRLAKNANPSQFRLEPWTIWRMPGRDWDDRLKVFKDSPKHNWASHAADSFGYMAMGWKQTAKPEPTPRPPLYKPLSAMSYDEFDDAIEITYQGTKIIRADRRPRRPDRV